MAHTGIPESHLDLFKKKAFAHLATLMPDGKPQVTPVWVDYDGTYMLINTTLERQKGRNMPSNPKVALLVIDPQDGSRWIEVRGKVVEIKREGVEAHADKLTQRYTGKQRFYGDIYPVEQKQKETRIIIKIEPIKVSLDAIFK